MGQACLSRQSSLGEGTCSPQAASIFGNFFQLRTTVPRRDGGLGPVNKSCSVFGAVENRPIFTATDYGGDIL